PREVLRYGIRIEPGRSDHPRRSADRPVDLFQRSGIYHIARTRNPAKRGPGRDPTDPARGGGNDRDRKSLAQDGAEPWGIVEQPARKAEPAFVGQKNRMWDRCTFEHHAASPDGLD